MGSLREIKLGRGQSREDVRREGRGRQGLEGRKGSEGGEGGREGRKELSGRG